MRDSVGAGSGGRGTTSHAGYNHGVEKIAWFILFILAIIAYAAIVRTFWQIFIRRRGGRR